MSQKTWRVYVARAYWHEAFVVVEAENEREAESLALENLDDTELKISDSFSEMDTAECQGEVKPYVS